jgi:two-component system chemotaxis response regulator CheB
MDALPPDVLEAAEARITGVTCPECAGSLEVTREGRASLRFMCRVKHSFSVEALLTGKEERLEDDLWAVVRGLQELAVLLNDLERFAQRFGRDEIGGPHDARIRRARLHIDRLREILEENEPVDLTVPVERARQESGSSPPTGG